MHNVMILTTSLYEGGAERVIAHLAKHLDRSRFRVTIAFQQERGGVGESLEAAGYDVVGLGAGRAGLSRYLSSGPVLRAVRGRHIDLVHTHTTGSLADAAMCRLATRGRVKLVHTFHFGNYPRLPRKYLLMERAGALAANHLVAVGVEQMAMLRSLHPSWATPLTAIANGSEYPSAEVDREWAKRLAGDKRPVVGTTAVFTEQKGLDYLLDVAAVLRAQSVDALFVVAGTGPLKDRIEARCRAMDLHEHVLFTGWKPRAGSTITPLFDVFVQPSLWEAMSVVVLEAMAAGKPVVATAVGENRHVIVDGETGYVVPPRDVPAMAAAVCRLVGSEALRRRLGEAGRRRFEDRYTAAIMTRSYERVYDRVLRSRGASVAAGANESHPCTT